MQIWLETNIDAHSFIPEEYWINNYQMVKTVLPDSEVLMYEDYMLKGFIGITNGSYIAGLFVAKQFQGGGIGGQLITECKKRYAFLELDVYIKNSKSVDFYTKHGFKVKHEIINSDTGEKEYRMQWKI